MASEAQKVFTNLRIALLDGINHAPFHENPEKVMNHVGEFANAVWIKYVQRIIHILVTH